MKVRLTFKTPDVTYDAMREASEEDYDKLERLLMKYVEYDEYLVVEFDTEAQTATVIACK